MGIRKRINGLAAGALAAMSIFAASESTAHANEVAQAGNFGLGIVFGLPFSGLTGNYFIENDRSLQINLTLRSRGNGHHRTTAFGTRVDYLFHMDPLISGSAAELTWYVGPGANLYVWDYDHHHDDGSHGNHSHRHDHSWDRRDGFYLGVEVPIGLAVQLQKVPVDIFAELVPTLSLISGGDVHLDPDLWANIGARYYFLRQGLRLRWPPLRRGHDFLETRRAHRSGQALPARR